MTYELDGRQYLTMFVGDGKGAAQIVSLTLP